MIIKCPECGKEISDKATSCPNCGCPMQQSTQNEKQNFTGANQQIPTQSLPLPQPQQQSQSFQPIPSAPRPDPLENDKNSKLGISALILSILGCTFWLGILLAVIDLLKRDGRKKTCAIIAIIISAVWVFIGAAMIGSGNEKENTDNKNTIEKTRESQEEKEVETEELEISREDFITSCEEIDYKTLARNPDDYVGNHIKLTVKISQIIQGGFLDDGEYYRVYTDDEYGFWAGDEYLISDGRTEKDIKILQDDIIEVYGKFSGTRTMERALTKTKEDVLCVEAVYIELVDGKGVSDAEKGENASSQSEDSGEEAEVLAEYTLSDGIGWYTRHFIVVKNTSSNTVDISTSSLAYSNDDTMVGAANGRFDALGSGCTSAFYEAFETDAEIDHYETDITSSKSKYYESVIQDLSYEQNDISGGAIFQVTNNGPDSASFVEGVALFFKDGNLVNYEIAYFTDDDSELKPGKTISKQLNCNKDFDSIEFYLSGRK